MIIAALVFGTGIMILQLSRDGFPVRALYVLLVISYFTGGLLYPGLRLGIKPAYALWGIIMSDIILETAIIHYSGGMASQFSLIFCLTIISAALLLQIPGGIGAAAAASVCYILYGLAAGRGYLDPPAGGLEYADAAGILQSYMHVSIFLLVGAVSGYISGKMKIKVIQLENAETRLKRLRVDTDNILNHMSSGVLVADSEGKILTINPAAEEILSIARRDIVSMNLQDAFQYSIPELAFELNSALKAGRSRFRHEITVRSGGRKAVPMGISISLLNDDEGIRRGVIAVFQDLTEVREMQTRIRKADRLAAIGQLSAGIAHELRNPLASISGSIEMLYNDLRLSGEHKHLMELIMKESDRLDRIINDFLEFARIRMPAASRVNLQSVLEEMLTLLKNTRILKRGIRAEILGDCGDLEIKADEEQMKQVFLNLAVNACEAMESGGELVITMEPHDNERVKVAFIDEGPGISDDEKRKLFEPFFTTKEGGTGLGLAIANKIITAHGGIIEFKNREEGGAEFSVVMPIYRETREAVFQRSGM